MNIQVRLPYRPTKGLLRTVDVVEKSDCETENFELEIDESDSLFRLTTKSTGAASISTLFPFFSKEIRTSCLSNPTNSMEIVIKDTVTCRIFWRRGSVAGDNRTILFPHKRPSQEVLVDDPGSVAFSINKQLS